MYLLEFIASDSYLDRQPEVLEISSSYVEDLAEQVRNQAALNLAKISVLWEGVSSNRERWMMQVLGGLAGKADKEIVKPLVRKAEHLGIEQRHQAYIDWFLAH